MVTFNSFEELVQSTQNQPLDVSSNPNGTVTSGAVQPPASIPPSGRDGAKAGGDDTPPEWHNQLARRVEQGFAATNQKFGQIDQKFGQIDQKFGQVDQRLTNLEKKVDDGFAKVDKGFDIVEHMRTGMNQKFGQIDQQFGKVNQALEEIKKQLQRN
jgi:flagellar capping protein FliD